MKNFHYFNDIKMFMRVKCYSDAQNGYAAEGCLGVVVYYIIFLPPSLAEEVIFLVASIYVCISVLI